jgi:LysM repeat protein
MKFVVNISMAMRISRNSFSLLAQMKRMLLISAGLACLILSLFSINVRAGTSQIVRFSSPSELISAVNDLRATYGLSPYIPNDILMGIAQQHAEYLLSAGTSTHYSADGLSPSQRALKAGYAVAGDLSMGGFFSENITGGSGKTAQEAVDSWTKDDPHLNTMISSNLQDIGAGVAVSGNTYIYVIDCGLSTGGTPATFGPPPSYQTSIATLIPNTPNADGSIFHIVKPGDTTSMIAYSYGISFDKLLTLNGLQSDSVIYPEQTLIIRSANTATPTPPTSTPSKIQTLTPWPTVTLTRLPATVSPTPLHQRASSNSTNAAVIIVLVALGSAALIAIFGSRKK